MDARALRKAVAAEIDDQLPVAIMRLGARHLERPLWVVRKRRLVRAFLARAVGDAAMPDLVELWGLPTARRVQSRVRGEGVVPFVGDLNVTALALWSVMQREAAQVGVAMPWWGVDDGWLATMHEGFLPRVTLAMERWEKKLWRWLRYAATVDWTAHLGARSVALLDGGDTVHLEACLLPHWAQPALWKHVLTRWGVGGVDPHPPA